jgi:hypothetical protein
VANTLEACHARELGFACWGLTEIANTDHGSQFTVADAVLAQGC